MLSKNVRPNKLMSCLIVTSWILAHHQISNLNIQVESLQAKICRDLSDMQQLQGLNRDNPIDNYFDSFDWSGRGSTLEMRIFANMYRGAWYDEMIHAYALLHKKANPRSPVPEEIINSRDSFIDYVENEGQVYAYVENSNAFGDEFSGEHSENISTGTTFPATASNKKAIYYKQRTLEIYEIISSMGYENNSSFIFKPTKEMENFFANIDPEREQKHPDEGDLSFLEKAT